MVCSVLMMMINMAAVAIITTIPPFTIVFNTLTDQLVLLIDNKVSNECVFLFAYPPALMQSPPCLRIYTVFDFYDQQRYTTTTTCSVNEFLLFIFLLF